MVSSGNHPTVKPVTHHGIRRPSVVKDLECILGFRTQLLQHLRGFLERQFHQWSRWNRAGQLPLDRHTPRFRCFYRQSMPFLYLGDQLQTFSPCRFNTFMVHARIV